MQFLKNKTKPQIPLVYSYANISVRVGGATQILVCHAQPKFPRSGTTLYEIALVYAMYYRGLRCLIPTIFPPRKTVVFDVL